LATLRTRIRFPYRGAEEGVILGILGDRLQPRRPAQLRATPLNRVDRVDILAGSAPISRGIAVSRRERGGILHGSSGWRRRATVQWATAFRSFAISGRVEEQCSGESRLPCERRHSHALEGRSR